MSTADEIHARRDEAYRKVLRHAIMYGQGWAFVRSTGGKLKPYSARRTKYSADNFWS